MTLKNESMADLVEVTDISFKSREEMIEDGTYSQLG
jgi:hypothetical protein